MQCRECARQAAKPHMASFRLLRNCAPELQGRSCPVWLLTHHCQVHISHLRHPLERIKSDCRQAPAVQLFAQCKWTQEVCPPRSSHQGLGLMSHHSLLLQEQHFHRCGDRTFANAGHVLVACRSYGETSEAASLRGRCTMSAAELLVLSVDQRGIVGVMQAVPLLLSASV